MKRLCKKGQLRAKFAHDTQNNNCEAMLGIKENDKFKIEYRRAKNMFNLKLPSLQLEFTIYTYDEGDDQRLLDLKDSIELFSDRPLMLYLPKLDDLEGQLDLFRKEDVLDAPLDDFLDSLVELGKKSKNKTSQIGAPINSITKTSMQMFGCSEILDSDSMIKEYINENLWKFREFESARNLVFKNLGNYRKTDISASLLLTLFNIPGSSKEIVLLQPDLDQIALEARNKLNVRESREILYLAKALWVIELLGFLKYTSIAGCYYCQKESILNIKELPKFDEFLVNSQHLKLCIEEKIIARRMIESSLFLKNDGNSQSFDVILPRYKAPEVIRQLCEYIDKGTYSSDSQRYKEEYFASFESDLRFQTKQAFTDEEIETYSIFFTLYAQSYDM